VLPYLQQACDAGCSSDQISYFCAAGLLLQPRQLAAAAAARLCDLPDGPTAIGYGGARGGGKSYWLLAQMGADDCQRVPGLKCLLLRKVGKANLEHFEDLRRRIFRRLDHEFVATRGTLTFANGSRIIAGHYQTEADIDAYLGLEYDVIGIEEATTLTHRKYLDISTCCRSSKTLPPSSATRRSRNSQPSTLNSSPHWRPRLYSTTNPGGVGHAWYRAQFITPFLHHAETDTRFIPARVTDNQFNNPEYRKLLEHLTGWQKRAWLHGDWDIAAGQFFTNFRRDLHCVPDFDDSRAREWFAALDYGYTHYTVALLGCRAADGNLFVVDEHAQRGWLPQRHAAAIQAMFARHHVRLDAAIEPTPFPSINQRALEDSQLSPLFDSQPSTLNSQLFLARFVAGADVFSRQCDGTTIAQQYAKCGLHLRPAAIDRIQGWADILRRLGDPDHNIRPTLFIHQRCARLLECLPALQHDPARPEDILKTDVDEDGRGGDDAADCLRYLVHTQLPTITQCKLRGL
jgi:hypothetical protein